MDGQELSPHTAPALRSTKPAADVEGFFRAVRDAQNDYLDRFSIDPSQRPLFVEEWPKEQLASAEKPFDFIGFHVVLTRRASTSNTSYRAATGLTLLNQHPDPNAAGYLSEDWGFLEEAVVQFTIFGQSNARATAVANWLRALILLYTQQRFFFAYGINYCVFHNRLEDSIEKAESQDLYCRRVQFIIRTQNIFNLESKTLELFKLSVGPAGKPAAAEIEITDPTNT